MLTERQFMEETQANYSLQLDEYHYTLFAVWPDGKFTTYRANDTRELRKKIERSGMPLADDWRFTEPRDFSILYAMWKRREINVDWYTENERETLFHFSSNLPENRAATDKMWPLAPRPYLDNPHRK